MLYAAAVSALFWAGVAAAAPLGSDQPTASAAQIVRRSVAVNTGDWQAQPEYAFREHDVKSKIDQTGKARVEESKTYEVSMIEGSPYNRLIAVENEPLSKAQEQAEQAKLERETRRRQRESRGDRKARISKYQGERTEEHMLMQQMTEAFTFALAGTERVGGVDCYVLNATPNPSYRPPVEKTRVLTGMRGRLWIDSAHFHWVKVQAEVISPVEFALFIAKVKPGTRFELEQQPVGNVWLPKCFTQTVNATVLGFYGMRTKEEEQYFDYHQTVLQAENPTVAR
jgi:hypothetical protein